MVNVTSKAEFSLKGFSDEHEHQILHAGLFMLTYLLALMGNLLIISVISSDHRLYSPMYCFLKHLSLLDLCFISVTVPQSIANSLLDEGFIYLGQCVLQVFFFIALASLEVALLTVMSYDRYVAVCWPLQYETVMDPGACRCAVMVVWMAGGVSGLMHTAVNSSIPLCGKEIIHQFLCDISQMLKLACSHEFISEIEVAAFTTSIAFVCLFSIAFFYVPIFSAVLRMPSADGRTKVFSTCLPHLFVITFFLSMEGFEFLRPPSDSPSAVDLNPIIHSLRNGALKAALKKVLSREEISQRMMYFNVMFKL